MQLSKPFNDASKYAITVLDFITRHKLPYNPYIPLLYRQNISVSPEIYPAKPPDRSQLYRHLNPPEENQWLGGVPIGKILIEDQKEQFKLIAKQFKHKLTSDLYNPPLHLTYKWKDFGGETQAMDKLLEDQREFNNKHNSWRNQYRVRYCELTDMFFLQMKVNHMFPYALFECDIEDISRIFELNWYLHHVGYTDIYNEQMVRHLIVQRDPENMKKKGVSITRWMFEKGIKVFYDNNVLNCRRSNLVSVEKRKF